MAKFGNKVSGKCCLEDTLYIWTNYEDDKMQEFFNRTHFYADIDKNLSPYNEIKISNYKDIVPYLPRCESIASFSKEDDNVIVLQKRPHWAYEETDILSSIYKDIISLYNKCKRKKINFNKNYCIENLYWFKKLDYYDIANELYDRFEKFGKNFDFTDIHLKSKNLLYREPLINEMLIVGYSKEEAYEWVYNEKKIW